MNKLKKFIHEMPRYPARIAVSAIVAAALIWFLLAQIEIGALMSALRDMDRRCLVLFVFFLLGELFLKGYRYSQIHRSVGLVRLIQISFIHSLALIVVPARGGELAYLYLLKNNGEPYSKSVGALVLFRLMDLLCVILLLFLSLLFLEGVPASVARFYPHIVALALCIGLAIASLIFMSQYYARIINKFSYGKVSIHLKAAIQTLGDIDKKQLVSIFFSSLAIWVSSGLSLHFIFRALFEVDVFTSFAVNSFYILTLVVPVHGFMGFGTMEAPVYLLLLLFGFAKEQSLAASFIAHIFPLAVLILLGGLSYVTYGKGTEDQLKGQSE